MADPRDHLKDLHKHVFVKGQEAEAQQNATERFEDEQALAQRVLRAATDTIDLADKLAADGNPHKQRLAALIKNKVVGAVEEREEERHRAVKEREPVEASPFHDNPPQLSSSKNSEPSLPGSPPTASLAGPTEPLKKKRGRKPKVRD